MSQMTRIQLEEEVNNLQKRIRDLENRHGSEIQADHFYTFFEACPLVMALTDEKMHEYVAVNRAFLEDLGFTRDEVIGKTPNQLKLFVKQDRRSELLKLMKTQGYVRGEKVQVRAKSGQVHSGLFSAEHIQLDGKELLLTSMEDITECESAKEASEVNAARLDGILNASPDCLLLIDPGGIIEWANAKTVEVFGYSINELAGVRMESLVPEMFPSREKDARSKKAKGPLLLQKDNTQQFDAVRKDGQKFRVEIALREYKSIQGEPTLICSIHDITGQEVLKESLKADAIRKRILFDESPYGILIIDPRTAGFLEFNTRAHVQLGYTRDEFARLKIFDLEALESKEETKARIQEIINKGRAEFDTIQRTKNGERRNTHVTGQIVQIRGEEVYYCTWQDITERQKMERALMESEARFRSLYENSSIGMYRTTPDGRILMANPALVRMLGYESFEELAKRNLENGVYEPEGKRRDFKELIENQGLIHGKESTWIRHDGTAIIVRESARAFRDASGKVTFYEGTVEDISEWKQAENSLRISEQRYRTTLENMMEGFQIIDHDWRYLYVNVMAARHGRRDVADLLGYTMMECYPGIEQTALFKVLQDCMDNHISHKYENEFTYADGSKGIFELSIGSIPEGIYIISDDVTEKKAAEDRLKDSEARLASIFRASPLPIAIRRISDGLYPQFNMAFAKMLGRSADEIVGHTEDELNFWVDLDRRQELVREINKAGAVRDFEFQIRDRDGGLHDLLMSAELVELGGEACILAMSNEITERKRAEQELMESEHRYRGLFENINSGVAVFEVVDDGRDFIFRDFNRAGEEIDRQSRDQLIGKSIFEVRPGIEKFGLLDVFRKVAQTGKPLYFPQKQYSDGRISGWYTNFVYKISASEIVTVFENITEQKQVEEALRFSEERYRMLVETSTEGIWTMDSAHVINYINPAIAGMLGYSTSEITGKTIEDFLLEEDIQLHDERMRKRHAGVSEKYERRFRRKDGSILWALVSARALMSPQGQFQGSFAMLTDITERKKAEEEILRTQIFLQKVIDSSPYAMWVADPGGTVTKVNRALCKTINLQEDEIIGKYNVLKDSNLEDQGLMDEVRAVFERHQPIRFSIPWKADRSGAPEFTTAADLFIDASMFPILDGKGELSNVVCQWVDMTERRRAEGKLRISESRFSTIFRSNPSAIAVTRLVDNTLIDVNAVWEDISGWTKAEVMGKTPFEINLWADPSQRERLLNTVIENSYAPAFEMQMRTRDGSVRTLLLSAEVISLQDEACLLTMAQDITSRINAEKQLSEQMDDLSLVNQLDEASNHGADLESILQLLSLESRRIFNCIDSAIYLLTPDGKNFTWQHGTLPKSISSKIEKSLGMKIPKIQVPIREGSFFKKILDSDRGLLVSDPGVMMQWMADFAETPFLPEAMRPAIKGLLPQIYKLLGIRSLIIMPLKSGNHTLGAFEISSADFLTEHVLERLQNVRLSLTEILERKQIEADLKASEEKYRGLMESLDNIVSTVDAEGTFLYMNDTAAASLHGKASDLIGSHIEDLFPRDDALRQMEFIRAVLRSDKGQVVESQIKVADGHRWYRTSLQPLHDGQGKVTSVLLNSTDIHELKTTQQALQELNTTLEIRIRERTTELRELYDHSPAGYHSLDANGRFIEINQTELNWLGYTREELLGQPVSKTLSAGTNSALKENLAQIKKNGKVNDIEGVAVRKDGSTYPIQVNALAIYNARGEFESIRSTVLDISVRKAAEEELRSSRQLLKDVIDNTRALVYILDLDGRFLMINHEMERMVGRDSRELLGKDRSSILPAEIAAQHRQNDLEVIRNGQAKSFEEENPESDGLHYYLTTKFPLVDSNQHIYAVCGISTDITERKQAEDALWYSNMELVRALRVKDEFLANMSHELRTPLNAIIGLSESLGEQLFGELNPKQMKYITTIGDSGQHLLALINDILDLSKIGAGKLNFEQNQVNVLSTCQASLTMIKEMAEKKDLSVRFEMDPSVGQILADERRLKQMLVNLLSNAVKFTPQGGEIGMEVKGDLKGETIAFTVWDTGIGISAKDQERLFQPFMQVNTSLTRETGGTGLGLALVAQMARLHGGSVSLESALGKGSRFTITLPWAPSARETTTMRQKSATIPITDTQEIVRKGRILIMEDTDTAIMVQRDYLEHLGYQVSVARNGKDGITLAEREVPDLILMDIQMPVMDGFETVKFLRKQKAFKNIPIIALTALAMSGDRERCLEAGMDDYLTKPVDLKNMLKIVEKYLTRNHVA